MTDLELIFIYVLAVNTLIALIYLIWNLLCARRERGKEKSRGCLIRTVVMILCPVAGPLFFFLAWIWYVVFFSDPVDLEDVVFSKERVRTFVHAEEERERNMVPLEEAIEVTATPELRTLMMNVVRGDIRNSLASIALALNSEDSETAHYAASVLQDALNDFRINVQKKRQEILDGAENASARLAELIDDMDQVLKQRVFNEMEQQTYVKMLDEVCELFFERDRMHMTSAQFEAVTLRLLEIEDYDGCQKWCDRSDYLFPDALATYTCQLKLYFNSGQRRRFFRVVGDLEKSPVVIDSETLELIRVFRCAEA